VDRGAYDSVDLAEVVATVQKLFEGAFSTRKIKVDNLLLPGQRRSWGNRAQLLQAFLQVFSALRTLADAGSTLVVDSSEDADIIRIVFQGTMPGVDLTSVDPFQARSAQDQAMAQGLGLWLARQIFQEHQGSLEVVALPERAQLVVTLPAKASRKPQAGGTLA
jgi:signal transduction histidine kinase